MYPSFFYCAFWIAFQVAGEEVILLVVFATMKRSLDETKGDDSDNDGQDATVPSPTKRQKTRVFKCHVTQTGFLENIRMSERAFAPVPGSLFTVTGPDWNTDSLHRLDRLVRLDLYPCQVNFIPTSVDLLDALDLATDASGEDVYLVHFVWAPFGGSHRLTKVKIQGTVANVEWTQTWPSEFNQTKRARLMWHSPEMLLVVAGNGTQYGKFDLTTRTWTELLQMKFTKADDGPFGKAGSDGGHAFCWTSKHALMFFEQGIGTIRTIDFDHKQVTTYAGQPRPELGSISRRDGLASEAVCADVVDIQSDSFGNLLVCENVRRRPPVFKFGLNQWPESAEACTNKLDCLRHIDHVTKFVSTILIDGLESLGGGRLRGLVLDSLRQRLWILDDSLGTLPTIRAELHLDPDCRLSSYLDRRQWAQQHLSFLLFLFSLDVLTIVADFCHV